MYHIFFFKKIVASRVGLMYQTSIRFNDKIPSYTFPNSCFYKLVRLQRLQLLCHARTRAPRACCAVIGTWPTDVTMVLPVPLVTLYQLSREENAQGCRYGPYPRPCAFSSRDSWHSGRTSSWTGRRKRLPLAPLQLYSCSSTCTR
jgi:hypothetical protein